MNGTIRRGAFFVPVAFRGMRGFGAYRASFAG